MSEVFLVEIGHQAPAEVVTQAIDALWQRADLGRAFSRNDLAALKLHVGEPGTTTFVSPSIVAALVQRMAATGAHPFLTDTAVLYRSPRDNAVGHLRVAHEHGFTIERVGAPFVPADGLTGSDAREVAVGGKHYPSVAIATAILQARSLLCLTHATGHLGTGLAGTLKNLGMGCAAKKAKLRQHHGQQPRIDPERCTACATCASWCPADAITVEEQAAIDEGRCIGCGECVATCREGAVRFDWSFMGPELQERVVEHAAAVIRSLSGHIAYVTVAQKITKDCDCLGLSQPPLLDDIGILASHDPVAIDQALLELVGQRAGCSLESMSYPQHDGTIQIRYAESLGLGESRFDLVTVET